MIHLQRTSEGINKWQSRKAEELRWAATAFLSLETKERTFGSQKQLKIVVKDHITRL